MGYSINCRQCRSNVAGCTYVRFGEDTVANVRTLCLGCAEKSMQDLGQRSIQGWVKAYIEVNKSTKRSNQELRREVQELRERLAKLERR